MTVPLDLILSVEVAIEIQVDREAILESSGEERREELVYQAVAKQVTAEQIFAAVQKLTLEELRDLSNSGAGIRVVTAFYHSPDDPDDTDDSVPTLEELEAVSDDADQDEIEGCVMQCGFPLYDCKEI
jgi:hypothetical protein